MKFVKQTICNAINGNCFSACLASVLGLDIGDVPNFWDFLDRSLKGEDLNKAWTTEVLKFLNLYGLSFILIRYEDRLFELYLKNTPVMVSGTSPRDPNVDHVVVYLNGKMIHDPYPEPLGIKGRPSEIFILFPKRCNLENENPTP